MGCAHPLDHQIVMTRPVWVGPVSYKPIRRGPGGVKGGFMAAEPIRPNGPASMSNLLKNCSFFEIFNQSELEIFLSRGQFLKYDAGRSIIKENETGLIFFVVLGGLVGVFKGRKKLAELGPGEIFGEMSILGGQRRSADVLAVKPSIVFSLDRDIFEIGELEFQLKLHKIITRRLVARLSQTSDVLAY